MLTSMYYSNLYRPYILRTSAPRSDKAVVRSEAYAQRELPNDGQRAVLLNKALTKGVVEYASMLSKQVVSLREASSGVMKNISRFGRTYTEDGAETAEEWLKEDIDLLCDSFNELMKFSTRQEHSPALRSLMTENLKQLKQIYGKDGGLFDFDSDDKLTADYELIGKIAQDCDTKALIELSDAMQRLFDNTVKFLERPLSDHMNFKKCGYYYNYKIGSFSDNAFQIIENGMLVDKTV